MKKLDLHIHTVPTVSDAPFIFSLETFKRYVATAKLDAVAITNHDVFDADQFRLIQASLNVPVFPGIEINVEEGHLLLFADPTDVTDFSGKCQRVANAITKIGDSITVDKLTEIFGDLSRYLLIPHYAKAPPIAGDTLNRLRPHIAAGEVDSAKKFLRALKDPNGPTPVLFSDSRMTDNPTAYSTRQTFLDCGVISLSALRNCLLDRTKVALSEQDGNALWQVFDDGQHLSTGLNVLIGGRSTGKTHTLQRISEQFDAAKYIRQFSLVQQDDAAYDREFRSDVERRRSVFVDQYLAGLQRVIEGVADINVDASERSVTRYIETLIKAATEADRRDAFSKAALFDEVDFPVTNTDTLKQLIGSVRQVIENLEFRAIIERHVQLSALKSLAIELIGLLRERTLDIECKKFVNGMVKEVKEGLRIRTSAVQVEDVDLYEIAMDYKRVDRFSEIVGLLKVPGVIYRESLQGFSIEARRQPFAGAGEVKAASGLKTAFGDAFRKYNHPYDYLQELKRNDALPRADLRRYFVRIEYRILNRDGFEVSGGERSEFRLLQEIADAQNFDILLVDEPESSFDNLFLKSEVNQLLKSLAQTMPVVVVTHNSTVGASVGADYLLYTRKSIEGDRIVYRLFAGYPTDKQLHCVDGTSIASHEVVMDSLEAGVSAYDVRRGQYEAIKN